MVETTVADNKLQQVYDKCDRTKEKVEDLANLKTLFQEFVNLKIYVQEQVNKIYGIMANLEKKKVISYLDIPILSHVHFAGFPGEV
ncbi:hypothetical protein MJO28_017927 [Puccinia striiformis f. sp. tritici]|nr:hypothetical protein MJO28_017927 [Puccinia striiformis f. sp. tritici]